MDLYLRGRKYGGLIFGMLIGLHIWGVDIRGGLYTQAVLTGFYSMLPLITVIVKKGARLYTWFSVS